MRTLEDAIQTDSAVIQSKMLRVSAMSKVGFGMGLRPDEADAVRDFKDPHLLDDGNAKQLVERVLKVANVKPEFQKYLTTDLTPLREALKSPPPPLAEWKQKRLTECDTDINTYLHSAPDTEKQNVSDMRAIFEREGDSPSFIRDECMTFLNGNPDTLGSSMVVTYLFETDQVFRRRMEEGRKLAGFLKPIVQLVYVQDDTPAAKFDLPANKKVQFTSPLPFHGVILDTNQKGTWMAPNNCKQVTVKNGTNAKHVCRITLRKDDTSNSAYTSNDAYAIRTAYDAIQYDVSDMDMDTIDNTITIDPLTISAGGRPSAPVVDAHLQLETLLQSAAEA